MLVKAVVAERGVLKANHVGSRFKTVSQLRKESWKSKQA